METPHSGEASQNALFPPDPSEPEPSDPANNGDENPTVPVVAEPMKAEMETGTDTSSSNPVERSSINVIFTDWVPAGDAEDNSNSEGHFAEASFMPSFGGSRPRYFQIPRGKGRIRPGLGLNLEQILHEKQANRKRGHGLSLENLHKKFKVAPEKPPCAMLNEHTPDLQYVYQEVKTEGSKAMPTFTCSVVYPPLRGNTFVGEGRSKKLAKNDAAQKVLQSLGIEVTFTHEPSMNEVKPHSTDMGVAPNPLFAGIGGMPSLHDPGMDEQSDVDFTSGVNSAFYKGSSAPLQNMLPQRMPGFNNMLPQHMPGFGHPGQGEQYEMDFTSDDVMNPTFSMGPSAPPLLLSQPMVDGAILRRLRNIPNFEENICLALNTIASPDSIEYESLNEEGPPHNKIFTIELRFNMQTYIGEGGSKKKAKADAARKALISWLGMDCYTTLAQSSLRQMPLSNLVANDVSQDTGHGKKPKRKKSKQKKSSDSFGDQTIPSTESSMEVEDEDDDDWGEYDLNFSDFICNSVREKYEELMGNDANYSPFKVLAGVVMTTGSPMLFNSKVIAVTTGTKCIEGDFMSDTGLSVNDCHAEILATRCIRDFLYSQIELYENTKSAPSLDKDKNECILEASTSPDSQLKYQLKFDVKFHLYISTSPCGDARIFSPKGIELEGDDAPSTPPSDLEDTHPNKLNRGVLRSKIEAGEGTIPSANLYNGPQTWDAIISGNALYTMSCSDKVCRWNVLGIQGALLYNLLGSIYYSSITLGSLHHPVHFKRAVYGRVESLNSRLEMPFHINKPKLMMVSREEKRRVKKSPNHAVCWSINWSTPEILAASKGRCEPGGVASRLTKRMQFSRFLKLYNNLTGKRENYADLSYHEAKQEAADYQKAKNEFLNFFKDSKLGPWIGKPMEQDDFKIK